MWEQTFWQQNFIGNSVQEYFMAFLFFLAVAVGLKIFERIIVARIKSWAKMTKTQLDDLVVEGLEAIHWPFYVLVAATVALNFIEVHNFVARLINYAVIIAAAYYIIKVSEKFIDYGVETVMRRKESEGGGNYEIIRLFGSVVKIVVWVGGAVLVLANLGYNVTSLVAGLGIGGLAVALAVQNILSDIFSAFSIYFDKPFKVGDFIVLDKYMGTIKKIGIKSTRIQALQGEEVVISNQELTKAKIQNFGKMKKRRIVFTVGVTYETAIDKIEKIPAIIKEIITQEELAEFDRAHFKSFGDFSLNFEIVYYVKTGDYVAYMDTQQNINLEIMRRFAAEGIEFAYPTQTIYLNKS
ncbi:mechanosensitive ion channel family protein [Candidatus Parcubacteria bacterium]|nr:MAG: mechanosensitive ion channel family protein [Candidatus Parcubacteria bacterium]